jgi:hypothetical protein
LKDSRNVETSVHGAGSHVSADPILPTVPTLMHTTNETSALKAAMTTALVAYTQIPRFSFVRIPNEPSKGMDRTLPMNIWKSENLLGYVLADLDQRIKRDYSVKISVILTGLSAFLVHSINLFLKGESSVGKSYNVTEVLRYFPEECVWFLGGISPKSLVHYHGVLLNKKGEKIDIDYRPTKPNKKDFGNSEDFEKAVHNYQEQLKDRREEMRDSYTLVDLSHKILVFLESPSFETFQLLRPILSHDKEQIQYQFVDKSAKGQLQTRKVILKGWPATIFLSTDFRYIEELATRSFTVTPGNAEKKIIEANTLTNLIASLPWQFKESTEAFKTIRMLIERLRENCSKSNIDVVVPFLNLHELFPHKISRDMRDFQHFIQLLKAVTLLYYYQRPWTNLDRDRLLVATLGDVCIALNLYGKIFETTRTGTEKRILDFYNDIVKTRNAWYLKDLTAAYNTRHLKKLSEESIRQMLRRYRKIKCQSVYACS